MATQTITIKYKNPVREGKKFGNVKTPDGDLFWFPRDMSDRLVEGHTIQATVQPQKWGDKDVMVITAINGGAPTPPSQHGPGHNSGNGTTGKDEFIFITGVVGRAMGSGKFVATDIKLLTLAAREAYQEVYGDPTP